ncbi:hypothetical protein TNCV_2331841 [Trichonephila clavipes]|nr:hypothetical protein TNCV_2331841 [Trichonephila clavipes]
MSRKKKPSLQEALDLLQTLPSESSDALTNDSSDKDVPANYLLKFSFGWRGGRDFRGGDPIGVEENSCCSMALIGEWKRKSLPQPDDIGYVIEGILHFARQINLEMDRDDTEELLDSQNQELTIDEFIEINDEELESLDPVFNQKIE